MQAERIPAGQPARSDLFLVVLHLVCFAVVTIYVNMYQSWAWLYHKLGPGLLRASLPVMVTLAVLGGVSVIVVRQVNRGRPVRLAFIGGGIVAAFLSLAIPDPQIPIKRVHVAEYIVLAFLVRYALSFRLAGGRLVIYTILVTALYGIHDEMLQGLHTLRYFGWRDIIVNSMAGFSGGLLGHGLACFAGYAPEQKGEKGVLPRVTGGIMVAALFAAAAWQIGYLYSHRGEEMLFPAAIPMIMVCLLSGFLSPSSLFNSRKEHGVQVVAWLAGSLTFYPLAAQILQREFL